MTVLSKSKIKVKDSKCLYFNQFSYKVRLKANELQCVPTYTVHMDNFRQILKERLRSQPNHSYYRRKIDTDKVNYEAVEKFLTFRNTYRENKNLVAFRHEGISIFIYTNELKIIDEALDIGFTAEVTQVVPMPSKVILFKKDPPATYRIYCKTSTHPSSIRQELVDYLTRTPDMVPSRALELSLTKTWAKAYFQKSYYFDYNDDRNTLVMHLLFPNLLGESYKLEKKQG
jgi:hypothetical protein